jgi:hypothetical protein
MPVKMFMALATESQKPAFLATGATTATGLMTYLEWLGPIIGAIGTILGAIFSAVLIFVHLRRNWREENEYRLRMKKLRSDLKEKP